MNESDNHYSNYYKYIIDNHSQKWLDTRWDLLRFIENKISKLRNKVLFKYKPV